MFIPLVSRLTTATLLLLAALVGCQPTAIRPPILARSQPHTPVPPGVILCDPGVADGLRQPRHVLALSSGGLYGSYTGGFLSGWTKTGTRPEFDCVTGVSVGSLIAPFAFLGPEFDGVAADVSTEVKAKDLFRIRVWVTIPFKDAAASPAPLRHLIESQINRAMLDRIAAEHRKGRRLYVATTNLETRRLVVWNLGAVAELPYEQAAVLFRDVLLASCSVPAMLPPVRFTVTDADGRVRTELHVDGGTSAPVFVPPGVFRAAEGNLPGVPVVPGSNGNVYAIVAGKLYPEAVQVRTRILPILGAATESIVYAHCRAALRQDATVNSDTPLAMDPEEMAKLFQEGERDGASGPRWEYAPPELCSPPVTVLPRRKCGW
jgi:predicted acylesterase/phospholipase RssA